MSFNPEQAPGSATGETPYDVLGLAPGASEDEIEEAYGELGAMFAPGAVGPSRRDWARRQRARLASAYGELMDPERKRALDQRLGLASASTAAATTEFATVFAPSAAPEPEVALLIGEQSEPLADEQEVVEPALLLDAAPSTEAELATPEIEPAFEEQEPVAAAPELEVPEPDTTTVPLAAAMLAESPAEEFAIEPEPIEAPTILLPQQEEIVAPSAAAPAAPALGAVAPATTGADRRKAERPGVVRRSATPAPVEEFEQDLEESEPAPWQRPPARFTPTPRQKVTNPPPLQAPRSSPGVVLPSRREAAQIAARSASAPPAPVAPTPTRPPTPGVVRRPAPLTNVRDSDEAPRVGRYTPPPAPPPKPRKKKRSNTNLAYQILTAVIALVLVGGTAATIFSSTTTTPAAVPTETAASLLALGDQLLANGNNAGALADYQLALNQDPRNQAALLALARYYTQVEVQPVVARAYIDQIQQIDINTQEASQARSLLGELPALETPTAATSNGTPAVGSPPAADQLTPPSLPVVPTP